eukprot:TRINITY_DN45764_c0_g1_i1.p1 TRINITY_DN45764_c0_g1~~TRINITY_DN45764_c0_g1_i1.p1  ORF type:complete len:404 (+),score=70.00 TRINITY_DN45764_c0_g1_i1:164-1213(+)
MATPGVQQWFFENGGILAPGVIVRKSKLGGNGMFLSDSSDPLPADCEVLSLPLESCPSSLHDEVANLPVNSLFRLAELLCAEILKGASSRWAAWFASLPGECGNWPEWRDAELLCAQKGPPRFFQAAVKMARKLPEWYKQLSEALPTSTIANLEDKAPFRRALSLLWSRRFGFYCGEEKVTACFPVGDTINHSGTHATVEVQYEQATGRLRFVTKTEIAAGDELLFCYGAYDNLELCTNHGFVECRNPLDVVKLGDSIELRHGSPAPAHVAKALEDLLAGLPPAEADEQVAVGSGSSQGCRAIASWRLEYRMLLQEALRLSSEENAGKEAGQGEPDAERRQRWSNEMHT